MPMDGLTLGAIARELNTLLEGGRVDRVQQTERDELILTMRAQGKNHTPPRQFPKIPLPNLGHPRSLFLKVNCDNNTTEAIRLQQKAG